MTNQHTVATYLKTRLEQLGLTHMFGVAGNFTAPFLDTILADPSSPIQLIGCPNELCAGYAADGSARTSRLGCIFTTYSVGAFNALNAIAGSYTEQIPVLLINGAPTNKEDARQTRAGVLATHSMGNVLANINVFAPVTVAAERVIDAAAAPAQIDAVITAILTQQRPGYLEFTEDTWRAPCQPPGDPLNTQSNSIITVSEAQAAATSIKTLLKEKPQLLLWAGVEIERFGLQQAFLDLLEAVNSEVKDGNPPIKFITTPLSKSVISEGHPLFAGCLTITQGMVKQLIGDDGCLLGIGGWTVAKNTGGQDISGPGVAIASHNCVEVGTEFFSSVELKTFIDSLKHAIASPDVPIRGLAMPALPVVPVSGQSAMSYDVFFQELQANMSPDVVVVSDTGFSLTGGQTLKVSQGAFVSQGSWLAIGWSVAAAVGVKCALPEKRIFNIVGDGAFQETCQALSNTAQLEHNTVVFVIVNGLYGVEQALVNPNPFRDPAVDYSDKLLNKPYEYNKLANWDLPALANSFGVEGRAARDRAELQAVFAEINKHTNQSYLVAIRVPQLDVPSDLKKFLPYFVGEDEIENPHWPPANKF